MLAAASDPERLREAGLLAPAVSWAGVARALHWRDLPISETAIEGLRELLPGSSLTIGAQGARTERSRWSPWRFVRETGSSRNPDQLRAVVCATVAARASDYQHPLLTLSGGLDSSIVAAALGRGEGAFSALTLTSGEGRGDERAFARVVAQHVGVRLYERTYAASAVDLDRSVAAHAPRPTGWIHEHAYREVLLEVAQECRADAIFTRQGGDNIFYNTASARPVLDRLYRGDLAGALRAAQAMAAIAETSLWAVLREAWRVQQQAGRGYRWRPQARFLTAEAIAIAHRGEGSHPWLAAPPGALPGKSGQIAMLLRLLSHLDTLDRRLGLPVVHPLAAQPVVEHGLGVPSAAMIEGGRDRALARQAFRDDLPGLIVDRRGKGSPDGFALRLLEDRLPQVRTRLLDGRLASRGLVDRRALEAALQPQALRTGGDRPALLALLDTEAWLAHWDQPAEPPPAPDRSRAHAAQSATKSRSSDGGTASGRSQKSNQARLRR